MTDEPPIVRLQGNLYDALWPDAQERAALPMTMLGCKLFGDVGRFRDAWIERTALGQFFIHVYTRNGGANRADYADQIAWMRRHPWFQRDEEDSFDSTYASFWFLVPPDRTAKLERWAVAPVDTDKRWKDTIALLNSPDGPPPEVMERAKKVFGPAMDQIAGILGQPRTEPS